MLVVSQLSEIAIQAACRYGFSLNTPARAATLTVWLPMLVAGTHGEKKELAQALGIPYPTFACWVAGSPVNESRDFHMEAVRRHHRLTDRVLRRAFNRQELEVAQ